MLPSNWYETRDLLSDEIDRLRVVLRDVWLISPKEYERLLTVIGQTRAVLEEALAE